MKHRWKSVRQWFAQSLRPKIPRLSRPWKLVRNVGCILLVVLICWVIQGARPLTDEWAFRRAERLSFVGPSEILGTIVQGTEQREERYMVGQTEQGVLVYLLQESGLWDWAGDVSYWEKTGDITFVPEPEDYSYGNEDEAFFLVFTDLPGAAYAELDLSGQVEKYDEVQHWELTAELQNGYFLFSCEDMPIPYLKAWNGYISYTAISQASYTVRVYDSQGELLGEESWSIEDRWEEWSAELEQWAEKYAARDQT